jgi:hypothetical protein
MLLEDLIIDAFYDGCEIWHENGVLHRIDGPALIDSNGTKQWFLQGKLHRTDGPAIEYSNGEKEWWIDNVRQFEYINWLKEGF